MARNDDIARIIIEQSVAREPRVRLIGPDGDAHWVKETPMELIWPNGDPVARDKEMLVERITEDEARARAGAEPTEEGERCEVSDDQPLGCAMFSSELSARLDTGSGAW